MAVVRIRSGEAGRVLEHYPAVRQASATWELHDLTFGEESVARILASGSTTLDSASQAVSAAVGRGQANPDRLPMANTSAFVVGRRYELVHAEDGRTERVKVVAIYANNYLTTDLPLMGAYPNGSTVRGLRLVTLALPAAVYDDDNLVREGRRLRIVWTYADGTRFQQQARVVRHDATDLVPHEIEEEILRMWPDINTRLTHHNKPVLPGLVASAMNELLTMLRKQGLDPLRYLTGDVGKWAVVWRTLMTQAQLGNVPGSTSADRWQDYTAEQFERFWPHLTDGTPGEETTETSKSTDGVVGRHAHNPIRLA